jgi:glycosyltransferase involved in cell wall biosynthesis
MKVVLASHSASLGGAARAATRLLPALRDEGADARLLVDHRLAGDGPHVMVAATSAPWRGRLAWEVRRRVQSLPLRLQRPSDGFYRTTGLVGGPMGSRIRSLGADLVNVHWVSGGTLSIGQLARMQGPVVWTLHDMWAFCGAEHHAPDEPDARWAIGYESSGPTGRSRPDIDAMVWRWKRRQWRTPRHLITPSRWLAERAGRSALLRGWPVHAIPNALPVAVFRPLDRTAARDALGLPRDVPVIAYAGGFADPVKGGDLLTAALPLLAVQHPDAVLAVAGARTEDLPGRPGLAVHPLGFLRDEVTMALLYSAADVVVVPSRLEALGQVATEAQACGAPVVVFDAAGQAETVEDGVTGRLVAAYDPAAFAVAVADVIDTAGRDDRMRRAARDRALRLWSPSVIGRSHLDLFADIIHAHRSRA